MESPVSLLGQMNFSVQCFSKPAAKSGEQHLHMLAASIVGTNKVSDSMSQFFPPVEIRYFQQMQIMVESRSIEGCNLSRHQMHVSPLFEQQLPVTLANKKFFICKLPRGSMFWGIQILHNQMRVLFIQINENTTDVN